MPLAAVHFSLCKRSLPKDRQFVGPCVFSVGGSPTGSVCVRAPLTGQSVLRQGVQAPGRVRVPRGVGPPQGVLRVGGALVPLGQRRVGLLGRHLADGGGEVGRGQLGGRGGQARGVGRPQGHRRVGEVGGDGALYRALGKEAQALLVLL